MANRINPSPAAALEGVLLDGMTIMSGGFGLSGNPESLIPAIRDAGTKNLAAISNNCGADGFGLWMLLANRQIRKMISSYIGENKLFEQLSVRKARARTEPARDARRTYSGGRRGYPGLLHEDRRRNDRQPRASPPKSSTARSTYTRPGSGRSSSTSATVIFPPSQADGPRKLVASLS